MAALCRVRVSVRLLLRSRLAARCEPRVRRSGGVLDLGFAPGAAGGVEAGGKKRDRLLHQALDICQHRGLVAFDGEQVVGPVLEHQRAGRLALGVERVEGDLAPVEVEPPE